MASGRALSTRSDRIHNDHQFWISGGHIAAVALRLPWHRFAVKSTMAALLAIAFTMTPSGHVDIATPASAASPELAVLIDSDIAAYDGILIRLGAATAPPLRKIVAFAESTRSGLGTD